MEEIIPSFKKSLFEASKDSLSDIVEFGIDSILEEGVLKDFPIVGTLIGVKSAYQNIHDRNLLKQTLIFIKEFNEGVIDEEKKKRYVEGINSNPKKAEEELGRFLIILNRNVDDIKSVYLAKIFRAYINEKIDWNYVCEYTDIIERMFISDIDVLKLIYEGKLNDTRNRNDLFRAERLKSLGIIGLSPTLIKMSNVPGETRTDSYIVLNGNGKVFTYIIFN